MGADCGDQGVECRRWRTQGRGVEVQREECRKLLFEVLVPVIMGGLHDYLPLGGMHIPRPQRVSGMSGKLWRLGWAERGSPAVSGSHVIMS